MAPKTDFHYNDPLERYAECAWRRLELEPGFDLSLVTDRLNIRLVTERDEPDICGVYLIQEDGTRVIAVNPVLTPERQSFTVAHEIGHHLMLPREAAPGVVCKLRATTDIPRPVEEIRADRFAAALLMPHWIIRAQYEDLKYNAPNRLDILCRRFRVSRQAMTIRLSELKLARPRLDDTSEVQPPWRTGPRHEGSWI